MIKYLLCPLPFIVAVHRALKMRFLLFAQWCIPHAQWRIPGNEMIIKYNEMLFMPIFLPSKAKKTPLYTMEVNWIHILE